MEFSTAIIDYDAGNLHSVLRACREVGLDAGITNNPEIVAQAERVIFPGVGAAGSAMQSLRQSGLDQALHAAVNRGVPVLGICLGCQISLTHSEENDTITLGLIQGEVRRFAFDRPDLKVPHIGWNELEVLQPHPVLADIEVDDAFYFVHGYYCEPADPKQVYAVTDYETRFCSAMGFKNYFATQFHPEKSGRVGLRLLENFSRWDPNQGVEHAE